MTGRANSTDEPHGRSASAAPSAASRKEASPQLVLDRFTPYRIVALGHFMSGRLAEAYGDENISIAEWRVLAVVAQEEQIAARDVVAKTPMDKMTVSRAVASLEEKHLIIRTQSESDRRVNMMLLSDAGRKLFNRIAAAALDYEKRLLSALSPGEHTAFEAALAKIEREARRLTARPAIRRAQRTKPVAP